MKKTKKAITRTSKDLAKALGLSPLDGIEWEVRYAITKKIIEIVGDSHISITDIANWSGTSRARITKILKGDSSGISLDILVRILGALGTEIKISFKRAA
jgi:transcriptional regulator with XRE-family HTH domain